MPAFEADGVAGGSSKSPALFAELRYGRLVAAVLIIVGIVALLSHERSEKRSMAIKIKSPSTLSIDSNVDPTPVSLDTWQSPTAFLLKEPDEWDQTLRPTDGSSGLFPATQPQSRHST
jgi:hypothetical protein